MRWWVNRLFEVMDTRFSYLPRKRFHLELFGAFRPSEHVPPQLRVQLHFLYGEAEDDGLQGKSFGKMGCLYLAGGRGE